MIIENKKLVITCKVLPPIISGSPVLMHNLFYNYKGNIEAICGWEFGCKSDLNYKLPFKTHFLKFYPQLLQRILERFSFIYFQIVKIFVYYKLKKINPTAVFSACTPDGLFFIASYIACKKLSIPFWGQMHDLWIENTKEGGFKRKLAKKWEPIILKKAEKIFCMTDNQLSFLNEKYPREYEILPHCTRKLDIESSDLLENLENKFNQKRKTILYTGNVSSAMNLDALQNFVNIIDDLPINYEIIFLISSNLEQCKNMKMYHPLIKYSWLSVSESQKMLGKVDLLFLPLSFKNCSENEVKTVYSTKTLDYLTSGTPILVYSPSNSFHSQNANKYGWGYVVDNEKPDTLKNAIEKVLNNKNIQIGLVKNAFLEARKRDPDIYSEKLFSLINE
jgi:glycosyltransferase involved in cell wall biosynthesis